MMATNSDNPGEVVVGDGVHVFPLFGRAHVLTMDCWCHPQRDTEEPSVVIHNVEH